MKRMFLKKFKLIKYQSCYEFNPKAMPCFTVTAANYTSAYLPMIEDQDFSLSTGLYRTLVDTMGPSPLWESTGITRSCLLFFSRSLGAVVGTGGSWKIKKMTWKCCGHSILPFSSNYCYYYFLKKEHIQTFNSEIKLAWVLASISGHPALPQSSLLRTQIRNLK